MPKQASQTLEQDRKDASSFMSQALRSDLCWVLKLVKDLIFSDSDNIDAIYSLRTEENDSKWTDKFADVFEGYSKLSGKITFQFDTNIFLKFDNKRYVFN